MDVSRDLGLASRRPRGPGPVCRSLHTGGAGPSRGPWADALSTLSAVHLLVASLAGRALCPCLLVFSESQLECRPLRPGREVSTSSGPAWSRVSRSPGPWSWPRCEGQSSLAVQRACPSSSPVPPQMSPPPGVPNDLLLPGLCSVPGICLLTPHPRDAAVSGGTRQGLDLCGGFLAGVRSSGSLALVSSSSVPLQRDPALCPA